jgi:iron complex outermembrane receptor protein
VTVNTAGVPSGGGDPVHASVTIDTHFSYHLDDTSLSVLNGTEVYLDIRNLFDQSPEFINGTGYDPYGGNPLGRVISVGVRAKF